jgi:hypothetical protein
MPLRPNAYRGHLHVFGNPHCTQRFHNACGDKLMVAPLAADTKGQRQPCDSSPRGPCRLSACRGWRNRPGPQRIGHAAGRKVANTATAVEAR